MHCGLGKFRWCRVWVYDINLNIISPYLFYQITDVLLNGQFRLFPADVVECFVLLSISLLLRNSCLRYGNSGVSPIKGHCATFLHLFAYRTLIAVFSSINSCQDSLLLRSRCNYPLTVRNKRRADISRGVTFSSRTGFSVRIPFLKRFLQASGMH